MNKATLFRDHDYGALALTMSEGRVTLWDHNLVQEDAAAVRGVLERYARLEETINGAERWRIRGDVFPPAMFKALVNEMRSRGYADDPLSERAIVEDVPVAEAQHPDLPSGRSPLVHDAVERGVRQHLGLAVAALREHAPCAPPTLRFHERPNAARVGIQKPPFVVARMFTGKMDEATVRETILEALAPLRPSIVKLSVRESDDGNAVEVGIAIPPEILESYLDSRLPVFEHEVTGARDVLFLLESPVDPAVLDDLTEMAKLTTAATSIMVEGTCLVARVPSGFVGHHLADRALQERLEWLGRTLDPWSPIIHEVGELTEVQAPEPEPKRKSLAELGECAHHEHPPMKTVAMMMEEEDAAENLVRAGMTEREAVLTARAWDYEVKKGGTPSSWMRRVEERTGRSHDDLNRILTEAVDPSHNWSMANNGLVSLRRKVNDPSMEREAADIRKLVRDSRGSDPTKLRQARRRLSDLAGKILRDGNSKLAEFITKIDMQLMMFMIRKGLEESLEEGAFGLTRMQVQRTVDRYRVGGASLSKARLRAEQELGLRRIDVRDDGTVVFFESLDEADDRAFRTTVKAITRDIDLEPGLPTTYRNTYGRHLRAIQSFWQAQRWPQYRAQVQSLIHDLNKMGVDDYEARELLNLAESLAEAGPQGKAQQAIMSLLKRGEGAMDLTDLATFPALRGVHYAQIMSAARALEKKGLVKTNGQSVQLNEVDRAMHRRLMQRALRNQGTRNMPPINPLGYPEKRGLEGPFRFRDGRILYYDPREGEYYDSKTDMYVDAPMESVSEAAPEPLGMTFVYPHEDSDDIYTQPAELDGDDDEEPKNLDLDEAGWDPSDPRSIGWGSKMPGKRAQPGHMSGDRQDQIARMLTTAEKVVLVLKAGLKSAGQKRELNSRNIEIPADVMKGAVDKLIQKGLMKKAGRHGAVTGDGREVADILGGIRMLRDYEGASYREPRIISLGEGRAAYYGPAKHTGGDYSHPRVQNIGRIRKQRRKAASQQKRAQTVQKVKSFFGMGKKEDVDEAIRALPGTKKGTYSITLPDGKKRKTGLIVGDRIFGVEYYDPRTIMMGARVTITHIPTGFVVSSGETTAHAVNIAKALLEVPVDWKVKDPAKLQAAGNIIGPAIQDAKRKARKYENVALPVTENADVANTIMQQIRRGMGGLDYGAMGIKRGSVYSSSGGSGIMGAMDVKGPGVQFDVRGHWKGRVIVRLDRGRDTYTVIFGRVRGANWKIDKRMDDVYASSLGRVIRDNVLGTGIRESRPSVGHRRKWRTVGTSGTNEESETPGRVALLTETGPDDWYAEMRHGVPMLYVPGDKWADKAKATTIAQSMGFKKVQYMSRVGAFVGMYPEISPGDVERRLRRAGMLRESQITERDVDLRDLERRARTGDPEATMRYRIAMNRVGKAPSGEAFFRDQAKSAAKDLRLASKYLLAAASDADGYTNWNAADVVAKRFREQAKACRSAARRISQSKRIPNRSHRPSANATQTVGRPRDASWRYQSMGASDAIGLAATKLRDIAFTYEQEGPAERKDAEKVFEMVRWLVYLGDDVSNTRDPHGGHYGNDKWKRPIPA